MLDIPVVPVAVKIVSIERNSFICDGKHYSILGAKAQDKNPNILPGCVCSIGIVENLLQLCVIRGWIPVFLIAPGGAIFIALILGQALRMNFPESGKLLLRSPGLHIHKT